jgi:hypothetical protein
MNASANYLPCDGCGLPASPQHLAERVRRLELSTKYRPVHIGVLFVALAPAPRTEDDFYGPAESKEFSDPFLEALGINPSADKLIEFQRRGYFLAYLLECPIPEGQETAAATIARLAPTLIRRIRFNYRPKHIAPLGADLFPLIDLLTQAGFASNLILSQGQVLPVPRTGDAQGMELFRRAVAAAAHGENPASGYDRLPLTHTERDLGAGGDS